MSIACPAALITRTETGDQFEAHAKRLLAAVSAAVRTSPANVEDACASAWLQLVRRRPPAAVAFAWLRTAAVREATKLQRRTSQMVNLDEVIDTAPDSRYGPEARLELIAAGEDIRRARLLRREARLVALRAAGYSREEMVELTGDTYRTVDRQLVRAQRKLRNARRLEAKVGSRP